jgi:YVTN family beta-propeller protein
MRSNAPARVNTRPRPTCGQCFLAAVLLLSFLLSASASGLLGNHSAANASLNAPRASSLTPGSSDLSARSPVAAPALGLRTAGGEDGARATGLVGGAFHVNQTLTLLNDTLAPGNFLARNGLGPRGVAFDSAKSELFVAESSTNEVSVISTTSYQIVAQIPVGSGPEAVLYVPSHGEVFVADSGGNSVSVISDTTNLVVRTIAVGSAPDALALDFGTGEVYVVNAYSSNVSVIALSNESVSATITAGLVPQGIAYDNRTSQLFLSSSYSATLVVISDATHTVVANLSTGSTPIGVAYDFATREVFVANSGSANVTVISDLTDRTVANIAVGAGPTAVTYDSGEGALYVANPGSNNVSVISDATNRVVATVPAGITPEDIAYDPVSGAIYIANPGSSNVSVVSDSTGSVLRNIPVGWAPIAMTYDSLAPELFVAEDYSSAVSVVNTSTSAGTIQATITVGRDPSALAFDPAKNELFVTNAGSDTVSVVSCRTLAVIATIPVGLTPGGIAYDSGLGELFVADSASGNLSIISDASNSVIGSVATGVSSWPLGVSYDATVGELFVVLSGPSELLVLSDSTLATLATVPIGTNPAALTFDSGAAEVFVANEGSSNVSVISVASDRVVASVALPGDPLGLAYDPADGRVFATSINTSVYLTYFGPGNLSAISDSTNQVVGTVQVGAQPDSVAYDARDATLFVGNYIQGSLSILPLAPNYNVTFVENGLPTGTPWVLTLNGAQQISRSTSVAFRERNGTFAYGLADIPGWHQSTLAYSGSVIVSGSSQTEPTLEFLPVTYSVNFAETGLSPGTNWSVLFDGTTQSGAGSSLSFSGVSNGTYSYLVANLSGWVASPPSGPVQVSGASEYLSLVWTASGSHVTLLPLNFQAKGLTLGVNWSVTLTALSSGVTIQSRFTEEAATSLTRWSDGAPTIEFQVSAGNFTYTAAAPGFQASSGSLEVSGATPAPVVAAFVPDSTPSHAPAWGLGLPAWVLAIGAASLLACLAVLAVALRLSQRKAAREGRLLVAGITERSWTSDDDGEPVARTHR